MVKDSSAIEHIFHNIVWLFTVCDICWEMKAMNAVAASHNILIALCDVCCVKSK